ncbi:MAG TPA: CHAD domain-containing protein [Solirubrobacteraceae bacterium]|nr:CHAD domain-containing protein [Solirubrobacteraceae bacterium]
MRARSVVGLAPDESLAVNVERILAVRVAELRSFMPAARDPERVRELHDMRIAAKRLRYLLELVGREVLGDRATRAIALLKELQDVLGDVHDCDVLAPRLAQFEGEGVDVLAEHLRLRRAERFARFRVLWPEVEQAATSCSHGPGGERIASQ